LRHPVLSAFRSLDHAVFDALRGSWLRAVTIPCGDVTSGKSAASNLAPKEKEPGRLITMPIAEIILLLLGGYLAVGFVFAIAFVIRGAETIDFAARGAPIGFRLLILPGATALWPLLSIRWVQACLARRSP
jgi:hypothetical protein